MYLHHVKSYKQLEKENFRITKNGAVADQNDVHFLASQFLDLAEQNYIQTLKQYFLQRGIDLS